MAVLKEGKNISRYIEEIESAIDVRDDEEVWIWVPSIEDAEFVLELTRTQVRQILVAFDQE